LRIAAPVLSTLFLVNVGLGFLSRSVPQLSVPTLGFAIKGMLAYLVIAVSLPATMETFVSAMDQSLAWAAQWIGP
jgi:flagellar biosynthetic protein FliR